MSDGGGRETEKEREREKDRDIFRHHSEVVVYYVSRNRELKIRLINEGRCDTRLKARVEEST